MEIVEMALKEKTLTGNGEDFFDDLLDFPNDDVFSEDDNSELKKENLNDENTLPMRSDFSTTGENLGSLPTSGLAIPMDDLPDLEWLSKFVEDSSITTYSPPKEKPVWLTKDRKHPVPPVNDDSCLKPPLPLQTRAKRARTRVTFFGDDEPMPKQQKMKKLQTLTQPQQPQTQTQTRKCSHCGVQQTPQWRTGPMGPKTLCNACGMRFNKGRLLPEYRPALSPTFSSDLHSNHHRRVVQICQKKLKSDDDANGSGLNQSVQVEPSF